jgi:hypothetical protein
MANPESKLAAFLRMAIQFIFILGGLGSFLTWVGVRPRDLAMTRSIPVPHILWLLLAIALFAVGIGSSVWSGMVQRRHLAEAHRYLADVQGRLSDLEKAPHTILTINGEGLGPPVETVPKEQVRRLEVAHNAELFAHFDSLQLEALALAYDTRKFLSDFEQKPPLLRPGTPENRLQIQKRAEWLQRMLSAYELRFKDRNREVDLRFRERGITVSIGEEPNLAEPKIYQWTEELVALAFKIDGIPLHVGRVE